jgi:hypothetical protein
VSRKSIQVPDSESFSVKIIARYEGNSDVPDVPLVCDNNNDYQAHKIILSLLSHIFKTLCEYGKN